MKFTCVGSVLMDLPIESKQPKSPNLENTSISTSIWAMKDHKDQFNQNNTQLICIFFGDKKEFSNVKMNKNQRKQAHLNGMQNP